MVVQQPIPGTEAAIENDSNADTCCLGKNFVILEYTTKQVDVFAYDKSIKPLENVPIVTGATAWTDLDTNITYILVINEGLYYGTKLDHSLFNPNQLRSYGIPVWDNPFDHERGLSIGPLEYDVVIPLQTQGTKIFFNTRAPTPDELQTCIHINLTSKDDWNPTELQLSKLSTIPGTIMAPPLPVESLKFYDCPKERLLASLHRVNSQVTRSEYDDTLEDLPTRQTYTSKDRHSKISAEVLSHRFGISLDRARATLDATYQRGTRSAILPLSRRYRADRQYLGKRLDASFSTDTLYYNLSLIHI